MNFMVNTMRTLLYPVAYPLGICFFASVFLFQYIRDLPHNLTLQNERKKLKDESPEYVGFNQYHKFTYNEYEIIQY